MPADVTGTNIITKDEKGNSVFRFEPGPIFANLVLGGRNQPCNAEDTVRAAGSHSGAHGNGHGAFP